MLVADSGLRKGFAASLAKTLVSLADCTRVISGRNSIEAIIKTLATTVTRPKRTPLTKAHGFVVSGELSTTFIENPFTFTILMDLFDGHYHKEGWENTLKSTGVEELKNISVNMLGAINPVLFKSMLQKKDVTGGFIARTVIIEENERSCINSLIKPPKKTLDIMGLAEHLKKLSTLEGQFVWDPETAEHFDKWYVGFNPAKMKDETGTARRIHDQITKVAMLLALAEGTELVLHKRHIDGAMMLLERVIRTAGNIGKGQGGLTDFGPKIKLVLDEITKAEGHKVKRSHILRKYWSDMTSPELDVIVITLEQSKAICIKKLAEGRDELYTATPTLLADLEAFSKPFS